ncbi:restriction endonuclease subunit S [Bacillus anthracis]|uniref:restriction endonuclease subunit S n=1 Tax=Bacillus anthracis TaxID=1392 RepID=UPI003D242F6A
MSRVMKDSGLTWIGEIPNNWEVKFLNQFLNQVKNKNTGLIETNLLSLSYGKIVNRDIESKSGLLPDNFEGYNIINPGDIVLRMTDLQNDHTSLRVGLSKQKGIITSAYITLRKTGNINEKYAYYYLHSFDICKGFYGMGAGVRQGVKFDDLKRFGLLYPPIEEQQKIANFLDEEVKKIDLIIENAKVSIEEYKKYKKATITEKVTKGISSNVKMKDSGIEWIGRVPEHFKLGKIKLLSTKIGSGKTPRGGAEVYLDSGILFLRSQNVYDTGLYLKDPKYISEEIDEGMKSTRVYPNDVLLNITGGSIGRCCIYPTTMKQYANVNQHVCIIRTIEEKISSKYLYYFINSSSGQAAINFYQTGANREGLNFEQIGNIQVPLPSIKEQNEIVDFLDERCGYIDKLIEQKQKIIIELEMYKESLIYECVSGKKEVL